MSTRAEDWFEDEQEFRMLCGDAQSQAKDGSSQDFAADMVIAAKRHGLKTYVSPKQLLWLCRLADWDVPPRIEHRDHVRHQPSFNHAGRGR